MTDEGDKRDVEDRRSAADRRSGRDRRRIKDRRKGQRRKKNIGHTPERRSGKDRRKGSRRQFGDRRRPAERRGARRRKTEAPFTAEERARVERFFTRRGFRLACPACGGPLVLGPGERRGRVVLRQVTCDECGRSATVKNSWVAVVMVIAREKTIRETVCAVLAKAGHEVVKLEHARGALERYENRLADVVLVDSSALEAVDGQRFIRQLRRNDPDARFVVVAVPRQPGKADPAAVATSLGANRILRMPCARDDILKVLKEARE